MELNSIIKENYMKWHDMFSNPEKEQLFKHLKDTGSWPFKGDFPSSGESESFKMGCRMMFNYLKDKNGTK